jgi:hypothetical protein
MLQTESTQFAEEMVSQVEKGNKGESTPKNKYFRFSLYKLYKFLSLRTKLYFQDDSNSFSMSSSKATSDKSIISSVSEEVLEVKTMLLQLRMVLELVRILNIL